MATRKSRGQSTGRRVELPQPGQGVHIDLEGAKPSRAGTAAPGGAASPSGAAPTQAPSTAVVEAVAPDGEMTLRMPRDIDPAALLPGVTVHLQYFRQGVLCTSSTTIAKVRSTPLRDDSGAQVWVELRSPHAGKTVKSRRFARLAISLPTRFVRVDVPDTYDERSLRGRWMHSRWERQFAQSAESGWTAVLGAGGMRLNDDAHWSLDDRLVVELDLEGTPLKLAGRVVWLSDRSDEPGVGVEFFGLSAETRNSLVRFVRHQAEVRQSRGALRPVS